MKTRITILLTLLFLSLQAMAQLPPGNPPPGNPPPGNPPSDPYFFCRIIPCLGGCPPTDGCSIKVQQSLAKPDNLNSLISNFKPLTNKKVPLNSELKE
ncbi:MAG: hypothetical protein L3J52_01455 [Proteobacteria bacterium]|nr:hypothetical protein [Pseudomonadota bacterium]